MEESHENNFPEKYKNELHRSNSNFEIPNFQSATFDLRMQMDINIRKSRINNVFNDNQSQHISHKEQMQQIIKRFSRDIDRRNVKEIELSECEYMKYNSKNKKKISHNEAEAFYRDQIIKRKNKEKEMQGKRNIAKKEEFVQRLLSQRTNFSFSNIKTEEFIGRQKQFSDKKKSKITE